MKQIKQENGRSMVEMLGVLAIMGVLAVGGISAYRKAMIKHEANTILNDARMIYMESQMRSNEMENEWKNVTHRFDSSKTFQIMRDNLGNNYVKVFDVDEAVCQQMVNTQNMAEVSFLKANLTDNIQCEAMNEMVILWNLLGTNTECRTAADCGEGFEVYCDNDTCKTCNANTERVNATQTGCECDTTKAVACSDKSGNTWCCGDGLICDVANQSCTPSDGACQYTFSQTESVYQVETDCHYQILNKNLGYDATLQKTLYTVDMTEITGCNKADEYCNLRYLDADGTQPMRGEAVGNGTAQDIYGVCLKRDDSIGATDVYKGHLSEQTGCPVGQYCYVNWAGNDCSTQIPTNTTGDVFGVCLDLASNSVECPI